MHRFWGFLWNSHIVSCIFAKAIKKQTEISFAQQKVFFNLC